MDITIKCTECEEMLNLCYFLCEIHRKRCILRFKFVSIKLKLNNMKCKLSLNKSKFVWIFLFCMFSNSSFLAQSQEKISGVVKDVNGTPLLGASILVKNTNKGAQSDFDGNFSISVSNEKAVLIISYLGYVTQEIVVGSRSKINVVLKEDASQLDEIVIIGYGSARQSDLTGSIAVINSEDISGSGSGTLETAIAGTVAGVVVNSTDNSPGAGLSIKIRGTSSLNASSDPLYVIDGFPFEGSFDEGGGLESVGQSPLSGIDPNDIESISILKDASATAIYGARGANGVVIITTKSGKKGAIAISYSTKTGVQNFIPAYDVNSTLEYAQYQHDALFPYDKRIDVPDLTGGNDNANRFWDITSYKDSISTNWIKEVTRVGFIKSHNVAVSGGSYNTNYSGSIGYYKNEGVVKETDFSRISTNIKVNSDPTDWLNLAFVSRLNFTENNGTVTTNSDGSSGYAGILQQAVRISPLKDVNTQFIDEGSDTDGVIGNPVNTLENVDMLRTGDQSVTNFAVTIKPSKRLRFKSLFGLTKRNSGFFYYAPSNTSWGAQSNGVGRIDKNEHSSMLSENTISYNKKVKNHSFRGLAGFTYQKSSRSNTRMKASNFPIEALGYHNLSVGESFDPPVSFEDEFVLLSYLARLNYSFKNRYLFTASFRADGSSKFASDNKWGQFKSFSAAWKLNEEPFIDNLNIFDVFKLRAGWGQTGNPNIQPYQSLSNFGIDKYASGSNLTTGIFPLNVANNDLKWETSEQTNIGLDLAFFDHRLRLTVDAYVKKTKDLLLQGEIAPTLGFGTYLYNSGEIENKGLEFAINGLIIDKEVKWDANFNISFNNNKVIDLGELTTTNFIDVPGTKNWATAILEEGNSIGLWYGWKTDGLWQQDDFTWNPTSKNYDLNANVPIQDARVKPGDRKFKDLSGPDGTPDGKIDSFDNTVIGESQPKYTLGFNSKVQYKNFDLSVFMEGNYGRDVYNANNRFFYEPANARANSISTDYWKPIQYAFNPDGTENRDVVLDEGNIDAKYPSGASKDPYSNMHDAYIEDGSYLRIKSLTLGYTIKQLKAFKSLRLYANVQNLYTFTNYSGYDPNVNAQSKNGLRPGFDIGAYPLSRTISFGLNVNL